MIRHKCEERDNYCTAIETLIEKAITRITMGIIGAGLAMIISYLCLKYNVFNDNVEFDNLKDLLSNQKNLLEFIHMSLGMLYLLTCMYYCESIITGFFAMVIILSITTLITSTFDEQGKNLYNIALYVIPVLFFIIYPIYLILKSYYRRFTLNKWIDNLPSSIKEHMVELDYNKS